MAMTPEHWRTAAELLAFWAFAGALTYGVMRLIRSRQGAVYQSAAGICLAGTFILLWINLAVGIVGEPDHPANLLYFGVPGLALAGAVLARFRPRGMARALLAAALAQVLVAAITVLGGLGAPVTPRGSLLALNGFFTLLWGLAAWLFQLAGRKP
ncbi:MAG: hypothetical protein GTN86_04700 [Xanthomonadales bacterium]|nr:hypothetical protein [Xanthomonadales bacterium]NIN59322.1 hypothetical protein [Xanthomonadales bacterium]NIN74626.1 hypothetical protein [Xanthomonadales bacterium]NIO12576.1 hypothetical protein [Xanthomonadales bacterium]NIP11715.1 hypothetical protein [Xanthomonadales bacterium]